MYCGFLCQHHLHTPQVAPLCCHGSSSPTRVKLSRHGQPVAVRFCAIPHRLARYTWLRLRRPSAPPKAIRTSHISLVQLCLDTISATLHLKSYRRRAPPSSPCSQVASSDQAWAAAFGESTTSKPASRPGQRGSPGFQELTSLIVTPACP